MGHYSTSVPPTTGFSDHNWRNLPPPPLPDAKDQPMISYILARMERILQKHPDAGIILTSDLN